MEENNEHPPHRIKAIFFDLDGVLVDAADWHREAFLDTMLDMGLRRMSRDEHARKYNGLSTRKKLEVLAKERNYIYPDGFVDEFYKLKQILTVETIKQRCRPISRIIDTCRYAAADFRTAVVTNCSRSTCEMMLELSGLSDFFEFIIANEDVDGKVKPHPMPYLKARYRMGLGHKEALAIDDTQKGIISAVDAQLRTWHLKNFDDLSVRNLMNVLHKYRYTI